MVGNVTVYAPEVPVLELTVVELSLALRTVGVPLSVAMEAQ